MNNFLETLKKLGPARLGIMGVVIFGLLLFFIYISMQVSTPQMKMLYKDLATEDSSSVAAKLEELKIPYEVSADGTSIAVPDKQVGKARMLLAQEGLPNGGSLGYELFDKQSGFGTTSFVQNITQVRALEGELAKTIAALDPVKSARVHLVLPQRELFSRETHAASASVFIRLKGGKQLDAGQLQGIQSMVASAVPDLKAKSVSIVDSEGALLAGGTDDDGTMASNKAEESRRKYEQHMTRVIEDLVGRTVGYGKVHANVTAILDFDQLSENSEIYDPQGQVVRSTQTTDDKSSETDPSASDVSVQNNLPGANNSVSGSEPTSTAAKLEETTNYEISKTIRSVVKQTGGVKKISASVLIDGTYVTDKEGVKTYQPRTEAEIKNLTALVSTAIGLDEKRGDKLELVNMQFADIETTPEEDGTKILGFERGDLLDAAEVLTVAVMIILVVLLVLQPMVGRLLSQETGGDGDGAGNGGMDPMGLLPNGVGQNPALMPPGMSGGMGGMGGIDSMNGDASEFMLGGGGDSDSMIDVQKVEGRVKASSLKKVEDIITAYPEEAVSVIRGWMTQET